MDEWGIDASDWVLIGMFSLTAAVFTPLSLSFSHFFIRVVELISADAWNR